MSMHHQRIDMFNRTAWIGNLQVKCIKVTTYDTSRTKLVKYRLDQVNVRALQLEDGRRTFSSDFIEGSIL